MAKKTLADLTERGVKLAMLAPDTWQDLLYEETLAYYAGEGRAEIPSAMSETPVEELVYSMLFTVTPIVQARVAQTVPAEAELIPE